MSTTTAIETPRNLDVLMDVGVNVTVELGGTEMPLRDVLTLGVGAVVALEKAADAPVDLYVNGKRFARGEVVVVENQFAVKITEILGAQT